MWRSVNDCMKAGTVPEPHTIRKFAATRVIHTNSAKTLTMPTLDIDIGTVKCFCLLPWPPVLLWHVESVYVRCVFVCVIVAGMRCAWVKSILPSDSECLRSRACEFG